MVEITKCPPMPAASYGSSPLIDELDILMTGQIPNNRADQFYGDPDEEVEKLFDIYANKNARKLDRHKAQAIRSSGLSDGELAAQYGVSRTTIWKIKNYKMWA